jgi:RND family efflux transporter MFP subunit
MQNQQGNIFLKTFIGMFIFFIISACREEPPPPVERIRAVKTITVSELASGKIRRFSGVVEAADSSSISFEVSGNVREVRVDVGDKITKGQVLAVLDKRTYNLNVKGAEAEVGRAKVQLADKRNDLDRFQRINKQDPGAVSQAAIDQSQAAVDGARKQVQFTKSQLKLAQRDLEKTVLRAPFDGVIATRNVEPFFEVTRGQKLFDVYENTGMEVAISIPEDAIHEIHMNQKGEIRFAVISDHTYHGTVTEISKVAGTANAFPIKLTVEDPDERVRPGMTAQVTLQLSGSDEKAAYLVPLSAISHRDDRTEGFVYVYDPETSTVKKTRVSSTSVRGNSAVITEGVKDGDIIPIAGVSFLEDGQKVKLMEQEQQTQKTDFVLKAE